MKQRSIQSGFVPSNCPTILGCSKLFPDKKRCNCNTIDGVLIIQRAFLQQLKAFQLSSHVSLFSGWMVCLINNFGNICFYQKVQPQLLFMFRQINQLIYFLFQTFNRFVDVGVYGVPKNPNFETVKTSRKIESEVRKLKG